MESTPAAPAPVATVSTDNPYGLAALWATGDIIARSVLILLLIMSLASWYVILTKLWDQRKLKAIRARGREAVLERTLGQGRRRAAEEGRRVSWPSPKTACAPPRTTTGA